MNGRGVEGVEVSKRVGIAVGFFACLVAFGFAFDFPFDLVVDDLGVGRGDLLGVCIDGTAVIESPGSNEVRDTGVEYVGSGLTPLSLDGPASGVEV
jgi:hypothetical protein